MCVHTHPENYPSEDTKELRVSSGITDSACVDISQKCVQI